MVGLRDRVSLRALLVVLAVLLAALLIGVTMAVSSRTAQVARQSDRVRSVYDPAAERVSALTLATSDMERGLNGYVLTGRREQLQPYLDGERASARALRGLTRTIDDDPLVEPQLHAAEQRRSDWITSVAQPAIAAMDAGDPERARELVAAPASTGKFVALVASTDALGHTINGNRAAAFSDLDELAQRLRLLGLVAMAVLAAGFTVAVWVLFRWVLQPLDQLREQIRGVARRNHHEPIRPSGPRELANVGRDVESMRRELVAEIDEARSARQALAHGAPVVAAIRHELSRGHNPRVPGLVIHGELRPAEGVLAGDWWDALTTPDGSVAVIVADIAGHGPDAGIAAMRIKQLLSAALSAGAPPAQAVDWAAQGFRDDEARFATAAIVTIDPADGALSWVNAGHIPPVRIGPDGSVDELAGTGPLLSGLGGSWRQEHHRLAPDEVLLLCSDGLVESRDATGEQLGVAPVVAWMHEAVASGAGLREAVTRTLAQARERASDWDRDDVTLVAVALEP